MFEVTEKEEIQVVIADDDEASLKLVDVLLKLEEGFNVVAKAVDGQDLVDKVLEHEPDLAIVDISMPHITGFEGIKRCIKSQPDLKVIFVTGIKDFAIDAFNIDAIDYIVKPMEPERLRDALSKAEKQIDATRRLRQKQRELLLKEHSEQLPKRLMIRNESLYSVTLIPLDDIIYIQKETNGKKSFIHTKERVYEVNDTVSSLLHKLDYRFIQTHRSHIVNINYIKEIIPSGALYQVKFNDYDKEAFISRNYIQKVVSFMEEYLTFQRLHENNIDK